MTLILSDKDVRHVADIADLVDRLERGLVEEARAGNAVLPERMNLNHAGTMFRVMPAILPSAGLLGMKFFYGALETGVRYSVLICAIDGGEVLAAVDAAYLTALRTGATSAVATRHLARADATRVGLVGSGLEAETNLAAVCAVRPVTDVRVFSRSPQRRGEFATRMSARLGVAVTPVSAAPEAVDGADLVIVATNTGRGGEVALRGEWLQAGQHVISIGSTAPFLREIDELALTRPDVVVVDAPPAQVAAESGDVLALAVTRPDWRPSGTLADVLLGRVGRSDPGQITLFKSVGTAAQDVLAAAAVADRAGSRGVGLVVPDLNEPKQF